MKKQSCNIDNCFVKPRVPQAEKPYKGIYEELTDIEKGCVANTYLRYRSKYVIYILIVMVVINVYWINNFLYSFLISLPVLGVILYMRYHIDLLTRGLKKAKRLRSEIVGNNDYNVRFVKSEAIVLTEEIKIAYCESIDDYNYLSLVLENLNHQVVVVEIEYNSNAYMPFWVAVDKAFDDIDAYNVVLGRLVKNMSKYGRTLLNREHNFPEFPVRPDEVPDAAEVADKLHHLVRTGLTNYQFAMIREQYLTQKMILANQKEVKHGLNEISLSIHDEMNDLMDTVSCEMTKLSKEQVNAVESIELRLTEQIKILDDLQSHLIKR